MLSIRFKNTLSRVDRLRGIVEQIRRVPAGEALSSVLLTRLVFAWGNFGYSASIRYLQQIDRLFRLSEGAVLECGSGASTLLLALLAEKYDRHVWSFENHDEWGRHIREITRSFGLDRLEVCRTPLRSYGTYEWYELPLCPLPHDFGLVVCDGPPGTIQGGRYGLIPVMEKYLRADCRILLDDTNRLKEKALIQRWANERRLIWSPLGSTGRCTEIAFA
ncbi:MAG: class I SAM-dependent methyltransferase [Kiritimatiellales bacterium]|nr:class I SAM-dependent methyltransferase [Kiritimatiellota bacterium]MBL7011962.1 class I SAM-dependent methyltransferase [Kiritimatiellales bacterium]